MPAGAQWSAGIQFINFSRLLDPGLRRDDGVIINQSFLNII